jgi:hypothetical protein
MLHQPALLAQRPGYRPRSVLMTVASTVAAARARLFAALPEFRDQAYAAEIGRQMQAASFSSPVSLPCGLSVSVSAAGDGAMTATAAAAGGTLHLATGIAQEASGIRRPNWHLYVFVMGDANYEKAVAANKALSARMIAALDPQFSRHAGPGGDAPAITRIEDAVAAWMGTGDGARTVYRVRMTYRMREAVRGVTSALSFLDAAEREPRTRYGRESLARASGQALEDRIADYLAAKAALAPGAERPDPMAIAVALRSTWKPLGAARLRSNSAEYWDHYLSYAYPAP